MIKAKDLDLDEETLKEIIQDSFDDITKLKAELSKKTLALECAVEALENSIRTHIRWTQGKSNYSIWSHSMHDKSKQALSKITAILAINEKEIK